MSNSNRRKRAFGMPYGAAEVVVDRITKTIGHADLTAAAVSEAIAIGTVPKGATVLGVTLRSYTPFTGGSISAAVVDIGASDDVDALIDGANVFAAAVDGVPSTRPLGIAPNKHFANGATINATFIATGDNVVNATAGSVTIDVLFTLV